MASDIYMSAVAGGAAAGGAAVTTVYQKQAEEVKKLATGKDWYQHRDAYTQLISLARSERADASAAVYADLMPFLVKKLESVKCLDYTCLLTDYSTLLCGQCGANSRPYSRFIARNTKAMRRSLGCASSRGWTL
jgi:hypothetical protein